MPEPPGQVDKQIKRASEACQDTDDHQHLFETHVRGVQDVSDGLQPLTSPRRQVSLAEARNVSSNQVEIVKQDIHGRTGKDVANGGNIDAVLREKLV